MSIEIIDILKPKNGLSFPVVEAIDVFVDGFDNLADAVSHFATDEMIEAINTVLSDKASTSDVTTATANLQAQINNIVSGSTADSEVINARVGADGTSYQTLKARLDAESSSLYHDLNDVNHYINAVANASGGITYNYDIVEGYVYTVSNNGTGSVAIRCNDDDTSYLIKDNVASGTTFNFTAEHTGKLRIYFYAASSVDISGGKLKTIEKAVISQNNEINKLENLLDVNYTPVDGESTTNAYYVTNGGIGTTIPTEPRSAQGWGQTIISTKQDDKFKITGVGADKDRLYCFTDDDKKIVSVADANQTATNLEITAPCDGYLYFGYSTDVSDTHSIEKYTSIMLTTVEKDVESTKENLVAVYDPFTATASTSVGITYDYDITLGHIYFVSNNGTGTVAIRCFIDDSSVLIKDNVESGQQFTFISEYTGKLRVYFYGASSVEIYDGILAEIKDQIFGDEELLNTTAKIVDDNKTTTAKPLYLKYTEGGYYVTNGGIGTVVDTFNESSEVNSVIVKVKKSDKFIITAKGGTKPKAWAFTDNDRVIVSVASQTQVTNEEITAPCDGYLYMGVYYTETHSLSKITTAFTESTEYSAPYFAVGTLNNETHINRDSESRLTDIINFYDMLMYEFNNYITKEQIGTSQTPEGSFAEIDDSTYPIYVYKYRGRKTTDADENKFILATGLHGDDIGRLGAGDGIEGVSSIAYLIKDILSNPSKNEMFEYIRDYCNIIICPVLNPWGYQNGYRHNGRGVDLNRNYSAGFTPNVEEYGSTSGSYAFSEAESAAWSEYIDTYHSDAKFMLEHHTRGGFSGITVEEDNRWNGVYPASSKTLKKMVKMAGDKMVNRFGGTNDFADHPAQTRGQAYIYFYSEGIPAIEPEAFRSFGGNPQFTHGSDEVIKQLTVWDNELLSALIELYIR